MPHVCHNTPTYTSKKYQCLRGIAERKGNLLNECKVRVFHNKRDIEITEVASNQYVLVTLDTEMAYHCPGEAVENIKLSKGTYLITIQPPCILKGPDWKIYSVKHFQQNDSFRYEPMQIFDMDLINKVPEPKALQIPEALRYSNLPDLDVIPINDIPTVPPKTFVHVISKPLISLPMVCVVILILVISIVLYKLKRRLPCIRKYHGKLNFHKPNPRASIEIPVDIPLPLLQNLTHNNPDKVIPDKTCVINSPESPVECSD